MIVIALGSNEPGLWGNPLETLERALRVLKKRGIGIVSVSSIYQTRPDGFISPNLFLNAVAVAYTPLPALNLLEVLKLIEAEAGRKSSLKWTSRPLDIDIIDYRGIVLNWRMQQPIIPRRVVLPHPRAHLRPFVLQPLGEIRPFWHHPVSGFTAAQMLKKPSIVKAGEVLGRYDWAGAGASLR